MDNARKGASLISQSNYFQLRAALFHSTPVLDRKRHTFRVYSSNFSAQRPRSQRGRQSLFRNINAYADYILQSWECDSNEDDSSSSRGPSWFRKQYTRRTQRNWNSNQGKWRWGKKGFRFCEDNDEVENVFRSAFSGNRYFYWSFINEENPQWRRSSDYSNAYRRRWRHSSEEDSDEESESESSDSASNLTSDRLALGLNAYGPLKLEDVKNAYRKCALKWHPDRHLGSSKVVAEEKFKLCSAAYQSLCDKLAAA